MEVPENYMVSNSEGKYTIKSTWIEPEKPADKQKKLKSLSRGGNNQLELQPRVGYWWQDLLYYVAESD